MNKYKTYILILFILFLSIFSVSANDNVILQGKVIYIDPGHGGVDPGAVYKDIKEESINLSISLKLKELLESNGAVVYLTRNDDYDLASKYATQRKRSDLYTRSKMINESNCDLYISIHLNAEPSTKWSGAQVFFDSINNLNKKLAASIQNEINEAGFSNRDHKEIVNQYMYSRINKPGVLIEVGFLSNYNERNLLLKDDYQYILSNIIIDGIKSYVYNV